MKDRPILNVVKGDGSPSDAIESSRMAAALEVVSGYERAIACLSPLDADELTWYRAQLRDARLMAGLDPVAAAPSDHATRRARLA